MINLETSYLRNYSTDLPQIFRIGQYMCGMISLTFFLQSLKGCCIVTSSVLIKNSNFCVVTPKIIIIATSFEQPQ